MRFISRTVLPALVLILLMSSFSSLQGDNVEFFCLKKHKASNTCHFNFKVDGAKYKFVDIACKFEKRKDEVIQKAKEGTLALSKDWKIECPEVKEDKDQKVSPDF
ncbi:hypothetical protein [Chryseosolibacter indicus]|uniref:Uncharacterized protein n=1 Tax=Chryseosolibacter indicus TaxID=2782351 RepID=A0ABS5VP00_9BACT|nr:hypothetical protein [Chryseosolibacter indicus]MBT1702517.1 hypothetical protein [Chryseosolibacter indicus]